MKRYTFPLALILSLPASIAAQGIDSVLSAIETNNIQLKAMRAEINAATHELKAENSLDGPSIEYSPFFRRGASGVASSEMVVSQEFDFPTLYAARGKSGKLQRNVLDKGLDSSRRDILLNAKLTCLELVYLDRQKEILAEREAVAVELQKLFGKRFDEGEVNILEVNRVKIENMEVLAAVAENRAAISRARNALTALNGDIPVDPGEISYPEIPLWLISDEGAPSLTENDTELKAAHASIEAARQEINVSRQGWLPKITLGYRRNTELDEASNGFLVGVSVPIFSNSSKVKAAKSRLVASQLNMDDTRARIANEVTSSLAELKSLHGVISLYDLPLMKKTLALMKKSVELGNMSVIDFYIESDKIYSKIQDYLSLENRYHTLAATLLKNEL